MHTAKEVKVIFQNDYLDDVDAEAISGVILEETEHFFILGKIDKKIVIGKRYVVKVEEVGKERNPYFEFDRVQNGVMITDNKYGKK